MEFNDLQKIWDTQNDAPLYAINENALHQRILSKRKQGDHIANISELLLIIVHLGAGAFIFAINFYAPHSNTGMYATAAWMFGTAVYMLVSRVRRLKASRQFDRSMHGDLDHAIAVATYQVRLSQIMRWNVLVIGAFTLLSGWEGGKLFRVLVVIGISFAFAYYVGNWEHRFYKARKRSLEILQQKLEGGA